MKFEVTKCICFDMTFEEMKKIMYENNINSLVELKKIKTVASNCKLCIPYINKMIETGETKFEVITE